MESIFSPSPIISTSRLTLDVYGDKVTCGPEGCDWISQAIDKLWSMSAIPGSERVMKNIGALSPKIRPANDVMTIQVHAFQDVWTFDTQRIKKCCIHVADGDKLIPFCAYNNLYRGKQAPYYLRRRDWILRLSLISPPSTLEDFFGELSQTGSLQQPLGVAYLSSYLKQGGQTVQLIDAAAEKFTIPRLISEVKSFHPDIIGISAVTPSFMRTSKVAQKLKEETGVPIIIGGAHVTSLPYETLNDPVFDYGVMGEGELTSLELLETIESGKDLSNVKGIVYRGQSYQRSEDYTKKGIYQEPRRASISRQRQSATAG